jgi:threonine/homoserine/homoserine lactone efflux protein
MEISFLFKGIVIGFAITAPVGPIGILCVNRTLSKGRASGFISGLGAVTADGFYSAVAAYGLTLVATVLSGHQMWFRLVGGCFLLFLGARMFFLEPVTELIRTKKSNLVADYFSAFFINLANPVTIVGFIAVFAGLGLGTMNRDLYSATMMVLGVILGSAGGWALLTGVTNGLRVRFQPGVLRVINRVSGSVILAFAVVAFASIAIK